MHKTKKETMEYNIENMEYYSETRINEIDLR
jgi:hypothetical protein